MVFFGYVLKAQIVSICAKIMFSQNCRDVKNGFSQKNCSFCVCYVGERQKSKWKKAKNYKTSVLKVVLQNKVA